jgi:hypothetical protein
MDKDAYNISESAAGRVGPKSSVVYRAENYSRNTYAEHYADFDSFADGVRRALPALEVLQIGGDEAYVFAKHQDMQSLGHIEYSDLRRRGDNLGYRRTYNVRGPRIRNKKYSPHYGNHNVIAHTTIDAAVRSVSRYLYHYSAEELHEASSQMLANRIASVKDPDSRDARKASINMGLGSFVKRSAPVNEVIRSVARAGLGVALDAETRTLVEKYVASIDAVDASAAAMADLRFVYHDTPTDTYHVGTVEYTNRYGRLPLKGDMHRYSATDLPEFIRDRIAVLAITNDGEVIPEVGARVADTVWCVVV